MHGRGWIHIVGMVMEIKPKNRFPRHAVEDQLAKIVKRGRHAYKRLYQPNRDLHAI